jgi:hypothetical protein
MAVGQRGEAGKIVGFKTICLEWHFGQVGRGGKKMIWEIFLTRIPILKGCDSL